MWYHEFMKFKPNDVIKCIDSGGASGALCEGKWYVVLNADHRSVQVSSDGDRVRWWNSTRFVLVGEQESPREKVDGPKRENVDTREEQLRTMLTTTSDPFVCKKCGAPKATCTYH